MKTICIYDTCGVADVFFFVLDGDYSHLDKVYINAYADEDTDEGKKKQALQDELGNILYHESDGSNKQLLLSSFPSDVLIQYPDTKVIVVGFIP